MYRDQVVQQVLRTLWQPKNLLVPAAFIALFLLSGIISLRILRRLPRFLHKPEMEWGARWVWLIVLSVVALALLTAHLALTRTPFTISSGLFGKVVLDIGLLSAATLRYQFSGVLVAAAAAGERLRGRQFDMDTMSAWLGKQERWWSRRWRARALEFGVFAFVLLIDAYMMLGLTYPFDVEFGRLAEDEAIAGSVAQVVQAELARPNIQEVSAYGPLDIDPMLDYGKPKQVVSSLREILNLRRPEDQAPPSEFHLFLQVTRDTTDRQARDIVAQAQKLLAERREPHRWRIAVYSRESKLSVHGLYPPTEGED